MPLTEDDLADAIIERYNQDEEEYKELANLEGLNDYIQYTIQPEVHYNHYGTRGVADLYVGGGLSEHVIELKSESALEAATGANEIIRQFNKMREYFYEGSSYSPTADSVSFELSFIASDRVFEHLITNARLYESALDEQLMEKGWQSDIKSSVLVYGLEFEDSPKIFVFGDRGPPKDGSWIDNISRHAPSLYAEYENYLHELADVTY